MQVRSRSTAIERARVSRVGSLIMEGFASRGSIVNETLTISKGGVRAVSFALVSFQFQLIFGWSGPALCTASVRRCSSRGTKDAFSRCTVPRAAAAPALVHLSRGKRVRERTGAHSVGNGQLAIRVRVATQCVFEMYASSLVCSFRRNFYGLWITECCIYNGREIHNFAVYVLSNVFESIENNESKEARYDT